jgi:hypothetical protein
MGFVAADEAGSRDRVGEDKETWFSHRVLGQVLPATGQIVNPAWFPAAVG